MSKSNEKKKKEPEDFIFTKPKNITDPKLIRELDKQPLYISPSETEKTFDKDLLKNNRLKKSCEKVGHGDPILVAAWFDDPNRDSETSEERVHLRIIEGRHRYLQDKNWPRKYIYVGSTWLFLSYQDYFGIRKKDNPEERKARIIARGNFLLNHGTSLQKIAAELCRWLEDTHWPKEILDCVPQEWKDPTKATNRLGKTKPKNEKTMDEKCQEELENLKVENQRLEQEVENLKKENQRLEQEVENLKKEKQLVDKGYEDLKRYTQELHRINPGLRLPESY